MQSLRRQIKRGNAVLTFDNVTKSLQTVTRRGSEHESWRNALKNRMEYSEEIYMESVTMPLSEVDILRSTKRSISKRPKA